MRHFDLIHPSRRKLAPLPPLNFWEGLLTRKFIQKLQDTIEAVRDPDMGPIGRDLIKGLLNGNCTITSQFNDLTVQDGGREPSAAHTPFGIFKPEYAQRILPFLNQIGLTSTSESDFERTIIQFIHEAIHACKLIETAFDQISPYNLHSPHVPNIIPTPKSWIKRAVASEGLPYAMTTVFASHLCRQNPRYRGLVNPISESQFDFLRATTGDIRSVLAKTAQMSLLANLRWDTNEKGEMMNAATFIEHIVEHALNNYMQCVLVQNPPTDITLVTGEDEDYHPLGRAAYDINILKAPEFDCWKRIEDYISPELRAKIEEAEQEIIARFGEPKPFKNAFPFAPEALPIASQYGHDTPQLVFMPWMRPKPRVMPRGLPDCMRPKTHGCYDEYVSPLHDDPESPELTIEWK